MTITSNKNGDTIYITINSSSLARETAEEFKMKMTELYQKGEKKFIMDFSQTEFADSSGIGKLIFVHKKISEAGGEITIDKISPKLYEFFDSLTLTRIFTINRPNS